MSKPVLSSSQIVRAGAARTTPDELRKKAHARLAERSDLTRSRHKPISLLRQEARRTIDLFLELEVPGWPKADRDRFAEDVVGEAVGLGPLEEMFRDEAVSEFMILAHNQVIARKGDVWMPTSVHFRDPEHYRRTLARMAEQGEALTPGPQPAAAIDVRLANGFRVVAVLPPAVLDQPPVAAFTRGAAAGPPTPAGGTPMSGATPAPPARRPAPPDPNGSPSGRFRVGPSETTTPPAGSGVIASPLSRPTFDPLAKVRQRITERLSLQLASAGVYDVGRIPPPELHRVVRMYVTEFCEEEKLALDPTTCEQLTLEILAGIHR